MAARDSKHTLTVTDERSVEFDGTDISEIVSKIEIVLDGPNPFSDKLILTLSPHKMLVSVNGLSIGDRNLDVEVTDLAVMLMRRAGWVKPGMEPEQDGDPHE